jgi:hypothetical protein
MRALLVLALSFSLIIVIGGCGETTTSPPFAQDNAPGVGDAAGTVDPVTGSSADPAPGIVEDPTFVPVNALTVLDFEGLPYSTNYWGAPENPASVLTDNFASVGVIFGRAGVSAGVAVVNNSSLAPSSGVLTVVGLDADGIMPRTDQGAHVGDIYFYFVLPGTTSPGVTDAISFTVGDAGGDEDIFQIRSYGLDGTLLDLQNVSGASRFAVSINAPGVHRVEVDFSGDFGYGMDDLSFNEPTGGDPTITVAMDIKPGSCPNPINPKSRGVTPVALLGSESFDVAEIDPSTLLLEGVAPLRWNQSDVATPDAGSYACECNEYGGDGFTDLTLKFRTQELIAALGSLTTGETRMLTLTGELLDGTPIEAFDCMVVVGKPDRIYTDM